MRKKILILIYFCFATSLHVQGDVRPDSIQKPGFFKRIYNYFESSNEDKTLEKKIDFSIIGGPHYSSDTKLGLGLVAAGLYRIDKTDLTIPPSNVSIFGDLTTSGFMLIGVRGNTLFQGAKYRLDYSVSFYSFPTEYWGIGYHNGLHAESSEYKRMQAQLTVDFMWRVAANTYIGPNLLFNSIEGKDFTHPEYLGGESRRNTNFGLGAFILYDSRDVITNPYKGVYVKLDQRFFPRFLGNDGTFYRTEFFGDVYKQVWKGGVLAYDLHAMFNSGTVPWTMMALLGGSHRMRGYYEGRFRDRNIIETQLELRQKIYNRHGIAVWGGAGNVFHSFSKFRIRQTLPNYGLGYRWEFKSRVNVRLDYGFGKDSSGFLFSINEAF